MYDGRGGGNVTGVTFFMIDDDNNTNERITLHVLYAYPGSDVHSRRLRNPTRISENHYTVKIKHPDPENLKLYLNARRNEIITENNAFNLYF